MKKEQRAMHLIAIEEKVEKKEVLKVLIHLSLKCRGERSVKTSFLFLDSVKIFLFCLHPYTKQNKIFVQTFRCAVALWKS